jgi:Ca2+-binding RTX toxin-like protein
MLDRPAPAAATPGLRRRLGCLSVGLALLLPAASAHAAECSFRPSSGELTITGRGEIGLSVDSSGEIKVRASEGPTSTQRASGAAEAQAAAPPEPPPLIPIECTDVEGGFEAPTVTSVDAVSVDAPTGLELEPLAPGRTTAGEQGAPEIEVTWSGGDTLQAWRNLTATSGETWLFGVNGGTAGANFNAHLEQPAALDVDLLLGETPEWVGARVYAGDNVISAAGGSQFAEPLPSATRFASTNLAGDDVFAAGLGPSLLSGSAGDDRFYGGPQDDVLALSYGNELADGGGGSDRVTYFFVRRPLRVDLRSEGPQQTGAGVDTLVEIENLQGGSAKDVLIGDRGDNELVGFGRSDRLRGLAGDDLLSTRSGRRATAAGGSGSDRLLGGKGTDALRGGAGRDYLSGHGGQDSLLGQSGADRVWAQGREPDRDQRISCGRGRDAEERVRLDPEDPRPHSC